MGQLDNIQLPKATVMYQDKALTVQGLTLPHITLIAREHGVILTRLYNDAVAGLVPQDLAQVAMQIGDEFSPLAGLIIACGMGEPEQAERASKVIPFVLQLELVEKIVELTLVENDGLGKTMEIITRLLRGLTSLQQPQKL